MAAYPVKITQEPDGSYTWSCAIEAEYYRNSIRPGFTACIIIAAGVLIFGFVLAFPHRDWETFRIAAGCAVVFMLIAAFFFRLAFSASDPRESYVMSEEYVKNGYGKSSVYFDFRKAKTAVFSRKYIELQGKVTKIRVYAPEEDFDFVRDFIQARLPGDCEFRYVS